MLHTRPKFDINLSHLADNYRTLAALCPTAYPAAVIKDNAYGLGALFVAERLYREGCRRFFVAHAMEGAAVRPVIPEADIYVLQGVGADSIVDIKQARLIPVLSTRAQLDFWHQQGIFDIHPVVQIETGLNRLGLREADWQALSGDQINTMSYMLSHLACADDGDHPLNESQRMQFEKARSVLQLPATLSASDGVFLGDSYHFDMVRLGAALYGLNTSPAHPNKMKAVVYVSAPVMQIADVNVGETVGYGATYRAEHPGRLAVVSIGYGDGLPRAVSNRGQIRFEGQSAPLIGRVSMDNIMCDVTALEGLAEGDFVQILDDVYTADHLAHDADTIGYEVISNLGKGERFCRSYHD